MLIDAGVPVKVVSERLGHATAAFTIETYQHVLPSMQRPRRRRRRTAHGEAGRSEPVEEPEEDRLTR